MPDTDQPAPAGPRPKQRLLLQIEAFSRRRYRLVFLLALLALVAGSLISSNLRLQSDMLELLPRGQRTVDVFREAVRDFGSLDYLLVLLEGDADSAPEDLQAFADRLAEGLETVPDLIQFVEYRIDPDPRVLELFTRNALLFVPPEELPSLAERLTSDAIREQVRANRRALDSPASALAAEIVAADPLGLTPLFVARITGRGQALDLDLSEGYYLSRDRRSLILLVKPTRPSQDLAFNRRLIDAVQSAAAAATPEGTSPGTGIRVRLGGTYAQVLEEADRIKSGVAFNLLFSLIAVSTLYWVCYRRFAALLYSSVPLMVGQALTFAVAWFAIGRLNSASAGLPALLMGLGTDFTIVMYARYVEERQRGAGLALATERMVGETGLGVFTGAITSAGTFYAMCISRFRGLFDLGLLIGTGILLCAVAILFMMPAMITWNEGVRRRSGDVVRKLHLQSFGLERLIPFSVAHRGWVLGGVALLTAVSLVLASRLEFEDSIAALRDSSSEAAAVQEHIARTFGASLSSMMAVAEGATIQEALDTAAVIETRLKPLVASGVIGSYDTLLTYLPAPSQQRQVMEAVQAMPPDAFDAGRVGAAFSAALAENGFRPSAHAGTLEALPDLLEPNRIILPDELQARGLDELVARYVRRDPGRVRVVTYLFPTDPRWKRQAPPGLIEQVTAGSDRITVTGANIVSRELRRIFTTDATRSIALGLVIVIGLLWLDFRSLRLTAIAMAQLLTGVFIMLGAMGALGIEVNYVNAFVTTMILGVGIDYSIHLVHRLDLSGGRLEPGLLETGKAVVLAALTNVAGFGTLALGGFPALRSFGMVALLGSLACLLTTLTLVPALMARRAAD